MLGSATRDAQVEHRPAVQAMLEQSRELALYADPGADEQRVAEHRDIHLVWPRLGIGKPGMVGTQRVSEVERLDGKIERGSKERAELRVRGVDRLAQQRLGFDLLRDL